MTDPTGYDLLDSARKFADARVPYEYGGGLYRGTLDCSEMILEACKDIGVSIPDGSSAQIAFSIPISVSEAKNIPGALLWREGHDSLSMGDGWVIEAIRPEVTIGRWSERLYDGQPRWTKAGLIPGINYTEDPMASLVITSKYGPRTFILNGRKITNTHSGCDVRSPFGSKVVPLFSGKVIGIAKGRPPGALVGKVSNGIAPIAPTMSSNAVKILRPDGHVYVEAHCDPSVKVGDEIVAFEGTIGTTDLSGQINGAHRHIELWTKNDPYTHYNPEAEILSAEPNQEDFLMALSDADQKKLQNQVQWLYEALLFFKNGNPQFSYSADNNNKLAALKKQIDALPGAVLDATWIDQDKISASLRSRLGYIDQRVRNSVANDAALLEAIRALTVGTGADPEAITAAAKKGAAQALAELVLVSEK